ncbi:hypothetical protein ACEWY4_020230 [Coilia grayii]|uniref:carbonic anhydrase n=1 Tax=Coilia grayii TaxID=363190 RepID=A0ABD1JC08_9TELE
MFSLCGLTINYAPPGLTLYPNPPNPQNPHTPHTPSLAGHMGQPQWSEFFPDCGGSGQSPINVDAAQSKYEPRLATIRPLGYSQHGNEPFTLSNNGHTVTMPLPSWMGVAGLPWQFSAVQLHLHWGNGASVTTGSEHTINGRSTAAELHIVHYNSELYENVSMAMTKRDGLAVLGILMEVGEETNQAYANIINYLNRIRHAGQRVSIPAFDIQTLLPSDLHSYYRYNGSLTTPPCYQSVLWTVFSETVKLSMPQLMKLDTLLYASEEGASQPSVLQDNYRATQPINQRVVLASFQRGQYRRTIAARHTLPHHSHIRAKTYPHHSGYTTTPLYHTIATTLPHHSNHSTTP